VKQDRGSGWLVGAVAAIAVACCAVPVIAVGAFSAAAGIGFGSWLLVGIGSAAVAFGISRRRRVACRLPDDGAACTEGR
jgi:hypothetical protein